MTARAEAVDLSGYFTLSNGLETRLMPQAGTPMVAVLALVRTGYASEGAGRSGFSHLLEHLVFAGTEKRTKFQIQREVEDLGGYVNGFTRDDYTGYLIVGHRDHLGRLLDVLSDMLFHSTIPPEGVEEAREVVLEEIRRANSRPGASDEEMFQALLYEGSPYARTGLGNEASVSAATREEIAGFYRRVYRPDNMILLVMGGFEEGDARDAVARTLGAARRGAQRPDVEAPGAFLSERVYRLESDLPDVRVRIGFTGPDPKHSDAQALELLAGMLGGGGGVLDRALKSAGLAPRSTSAYLAVNEGFSRFVLSGTLPSGTDPSVVRTVMLDSLEAALEATDFVDLMNRTREAMVAGEVMGREKVHYFLMGKAPWAVAGSPGEGFSPGRWDSLTERDLERVARKYLVRSPSVSLLTVPADHQGPGADQGKAVRAEARLDNGLHVVSERRPGSDVFALHFMTRQRSAAEPDGRAGIADFLHRMLTRGTRNRSRDQIQAELRGLGASLSTAGNPMVPFGDFYTSRLYSYIRLECLTEKAPEAVAVLADMVLNPLFLPEAVEEVRGQMLDFVSYRSADPGSLASTMLAGLLYPEALGRDVYGSRDSITGITTEDLSRFHGRYFAGSNVIVSIVSGLAPEESIALAREAFAALPPGDPFVPPSLSHTVRSAVLETSLGKAQGALAAGAVTQEVEAGDGEILAVASALINTRMIENLREKEGLAYSLGTSLGEVGGRAVFTFSMGTAAEKLPRAREALREQIQASRAADVQRPEMEREINGLAGRLQMRMMSSINRAFYLGLAARERTPHTFGEDYRLRLLSLSEEDVERVLRRYLPGDILVEAVVR